ncbi:hypothetical protein BJX99DRAFT_265326 [Aspergillus californicus]
MVKRVHFAATVQVLGEASRDPVPPPTRQPNHADPYSAKPPGTPYPLPPDSQIMLTRLKIIALLAQPRILDTALLSTVVTFRSYAGYLYNETQRPGLLFQVQFPNQTVGLVQCSEIIRGETSSMTESFQFHQKIRLAKDLVGEDDWRLLERRFGYTRTNFMQFEWLNGIRCGGFRKSPRYADLSCDQIRARAEGRRRKKALGGIMGAAKKMADAVQCWLPFSVKK